MKASFARRSTYLQGDTPLILMLAFGTLLSRFLFRSRILYHWDSVNFAFAMQRFDVAADRPHSPGYIVYVWLCRLVDVLFHDPQTTMVWLSIVGSGLAVASVYLLGRAMFGRRTGLVAALFLASSPLFWFYGEIALPHAVDAFLVILSAWLLYEVLLGEVWAVVPAAVSLAVAGGVRQQTPVFLALLALFAGVRFLQRVGWGRGWRWGVLAVAVFGLLCAGWFFPLINSVGGFARYRQLVAAFSEHYDTATSIFLGAGMGGLSRNLYKLGMYTLYGWSMALPPLAMYGLVRLWRRQLTMQWERALFLLAWVFPSLFFYTLIHMGQQGLVFVFLPALLICSAVGLVRLLSPMPSNCLAWTAAVLVGINLAVFCLAPEYPLGSDRLRLLTRITLVNSDRYYGDRFSAIQEHFTPESTAILAANWHHVEYYLPDYLPLPFGVVSKWEKGAGEPQGNVGEERTATATELGLQPNTEGQTFVVTFDPVLEPFDETPDRTQRLILDHGGTLRYFIMKGDEALHYGARSFGVR